MITVVLNFFAGIPVLFAAILLFGAKLEFYARLEKSYVRLKLGFKLLYGAFKIKMDCMITPQLKLIVNGKPLKKRKKRKKSRGKKLLSPLEFAHIIINGLNLRKLKVWGIIGLNDNAAASVIAAGIITLAVELACATSTNCCIDVNPRIDGGIFSLNLAGIVKINTVQIIRAAAKRCFNKMREEKIQHDASC